MGLVNRAVAEDELEARDARAGARDRRQCAAHDPGGEARHRRALTPPRKPRHCVKLDAAVGACFDSEDYAEGRRAFSKRGSRSSRAANADRRSGRCMACVADRLSLSTLSSLAGGPLAIGACSSRGAGYAAASEPITLEPQQICAGRQSFALKGKPEEKLVVKGDHRFDRAAASRTDACEPNSRPGGLRGAIRSVKLPPAQKAHRAHLRSLRAGGRNRGLRRSHLRLSPAERHQGDLLCRREMDALSRRARAADHGDPLFEIGNHSEAHRNLRLLTGTRLDDEILAPQRAFEELRRNLTERNACAMARWPPHCRPPHEPFPLSVRRLQSRSLAAVNDRGFLAIQWDLSTGDPSPTQSARPLPTPWCGASSPARSSSRMPTAAAFTPARPCRWLSRALRPRVSSS